MFLQSNIEDVHHYIMCLEYPQSQALRGSGGQGVKGSNLSKAGLITDPPQDQLMLEPRIWVQNQSHVLLPKQATPKTNENTCVYKLMSSEAG